ncbi:hypothetical protein CLF_110204 [Clonorchis sinensis]|uniref:Uncharacterized protein n=1 Tax=Clonorchis sinensis TaxID=79923 RepID=G7YT98_CLOSI|nr:hypothetical protein CLF_110204 [Clonorchis sinensis]
MALRLYRAHNLNNSSVKRPYHRLTNVYHQNDQSSLWAKGFGRGRFQLNHQGCVQLDMQGCVFCLAIEQMRLQLIGYSMEPFRTTDLLALLTLHRITAVRLPFTREHQVTFPLGLGCVDHRFTLPQVLEQRHMYGGPSRGSVFLTAPSRVNTTQIYLLYDGTVYELLWLISEKLLTDARGMFSGHFGRKKVTVNWAALFSPKGCRKVKMKSCVAVSIRLMQEEMLDFLNTNISGRLAAHYHLTASCVLFREVGFAILQVWFTSSCQVQKREVESTTYMKR